MAAAANPFSRSRHPACLVVRGGVPEGRASHREPDEAGHRHGGFEPAHDPGFIGAAAEHDAADMAPPITARHFDDPLAILPAIESFNLPDIRIDTGVLQRTNRLEHQSATNPPIEDLLVFFGAVHLCRRGGDQQLEHESLIRGPTILGELYEPRRLATIERGIALRVITHQLSVTDHCLRSRNDVNVVVAGKQPSPQWLDMDAAVTLCTAGLGIWPWASNDQGGEPDVVMACCGDVPTLETLAAVGLLRHYFPELKVRVINVVDLMRLQPSSEHPHGLSDKEFDVLFTTDTSHASAGSVEHL